MIENLVSFLTHIIVQTISNLGYSGVALLMGIESAAVPLPSEIIAPFAGYLVYTGRFSLLGVALAGGVGSAVGSAITYWIGYSGGRPFIERYGKYFLISKHDLDIADKFFARYGNASTFIGRLLPIVRTFISIPAGIARVPFWSFLFYSFVGSCIWTWLLAFAGMKLGENWSGIRSRLHGFDTAIGLLLIVGLIWFIYRHFKNSKESVSKS